MDKAICFVGAAISARMGVDGLAKVRAALDRMVARDGRRDLASTLVDLSDAGTAAAYGVAPVGAVPDAKGCKRFVDALDAKAAPDYILLVGGPDLFPYVRLRNPIEDDDEVVPSDLPYACDAPWTTNASKLLAPSRVVGRLPGLFGATNPAALVRRLDFASTWTPRPAAFFGRHLAVGARVWKGSTELSARTLFGTSAKVHLSPTAGPAWTKAQLGATVHFVNCHGAPSDPRFYGQQGASYPEAHVAARVAAGAVRGTVVSAECCYGADLFDPTLAVAAGSPTGIADAYLDRGACAFFGATTIAYGPANGNGAADLVTQTFLRRVLTRASVGRAALEARLAFVQTMSVTDPIDLKTLAQFVLLGDPSVTPIEEEAVPPAPSARARAFTARLRGEQTSARRARRGVLRMRALGIRETQSVCDRSHRPAAMSAALVAVAREEGLGAPTVRTFEVRTPRATKRLLASKALAAAPPGGPVAVHLLTERRAPLLGGAAGRIPHVTAVVVREQDGRIIGRRRVESR